MEQWFSLAPDQYRPQQMLSPEKWRKDAFSRLTALFGEGKKGTQGGGKLNPGEAMTTDYTPYQQKIIKRYYNNQDTIQLQRLAEMVSELYLTEGKKQQKAWEAAAAAMRKLGVPESRVEHLLKQKNPALLAEVVKELEGK